MDLYTMDLKAFANEDGIPMMDSIQFKRWTEKLGKERFREVLAEYIATYRPKFPLNHISYQEMKDNIIQLSNFDTSKVCTPKEQSDKIVGEKYDDYEYPYSKYGLGIIDAPAYYNKCSNYFHQHLRLNCSSWSFRAPIEVWENGSAKDIWKIFLITCHSALPTEVQI